MSSIQEGNPSSIPSLPKNHASSKSFLPIKNKERLRQIIHKVFGKEPLPAFDSLKPLLSSFKDLKISKKFIENSEKKKNLKKRKWRAIVAIGLAALGLAALSTKLSYRPRFPSFKSETTSLSIPWMSPPDCPINQKQKISFSPSASFIAVSDSEAQWQYAEKISKYYPKLISSISVLAIGLLITKWKMLKKEKHYPIQLNMSLGDRVFSSEDSEMILQPIEKDAHPPEDLSKKNVISLQSDEKTKIQALNRKVIENHLIKNKLDKTYQEANAEEELKSGQNEAWKKVRMAALTAPFTEQISEEFFSKMAGISSLKGDSKEMEETYLAKQLTIQIQGKTHVIPIYAIFDSHHGNQCSSFLKKQLPIYLEAHLPEVFAQEDKEAALFNLLKRTFVDLGAQFLQKTRIDPSQQIGSTAILGLIIEGKLWVANVGNSRAILSKPHKGGPTIALSLDAKANQSIFMKGFIKRENLIVEDQVARVEKNEVSGSVMLRAVGHDEMTALNPRTKIVSYPLDDIFNGYLVIASDGLWNVVSSKQVATYIQKFAGAGKTPKEMAAMLVTKARLTDSRDDISVLVVDLSPFSKGPTPFLDEKETLNHNRRCIYQLGLVKSKLQAAFKEANDDLQLNMGTSNTWTKATSMMRFAVQNEETDDHFEGQVGTAWMQGNRTSMEDTHIATMLQCPVEGKIHNIPFFAIFDGHDGQGGANFFKEIFPKFFQDRLSVALLAAKDRRDDAIFNFLKLSFAKMNEKYFEQRKKDSNLHGGSAATIALIIDKEIWVANAGDSRVIVSTSEKPAIALSKDSKPENFAKGIKKRGGIIAQMENTLRVYKNGSGGLAIARALGHDEWKTAINPRPKIVKFPIDRLTSDQNFLIMACDGVWDVASSNQVGEYIQDLAKKGKTCKSMAHALIRKAHANASQDNISAIVVNLSSLLHPHNPNPDDSFALIDGENKELDRLTDS